MQIQQEKIKPTNFLVEKPQLKTGMKGGKRHKKKCKYKKNQQMKQ